jgi:chemotaxis response regulator CheB
MDSESPTTKILFVDSDEISFQFRKCMAKVLSSLPPIELFHASDATEALGLLETLKPDVVVLDDELREENNLILDSIHNQHLPILMQSDKKISKKNNSTGQITHVSKDESIEGIHQTLLIATKLCMQSASIKEAQHLH